MMAGSCLRENTVPDRKQSTSSASLVKQRAEGPLNVLLVDPEPEAYQSLLRCKENRPLQLCQVSNLAEARQHIAAFDVDLAMIESDQPDGNGIELAVELSRDNSVTETIVISDRPSIESTIQALRAGASDFIAKPLDPRELNERIAEANRRLWSTRKQRRHIQRLRRVCRKLTTMHNEVKQQVDILCQDLVSAYQDLATQMNQVVQTSEFAGLIRQELDLEQLLRKTLEFLLEKAGPTNAGVFLPANQEEYTVGGYVNYDCTSDTAEFLLQHLADMVVPRVAEHRETVHITDNHTLAAWVGTEMPLLDHRHLIAFGCWHEEEALAVVILFREENEPFDADFAQLCQSLSPMLGEYLARLIRIHHRQLYVDDEQEDDFISDTI